MKVPAEKVADFLNQVKELVFDINETIRIGDDGFEETVNYQVDSICKAIDVFKLQALTPVTPLVKNEKRYGREYEALCDIQDRTAAEAIRLYKSELYFAIKRQLKKSTGLSDCPNKELIWFIEFQLAGTTYETLLHTNEFYNTTMNVMQEVADEIMEQRAKAPQMSLFP